jgi:hypothetical protein
MNSETSAPPPLTVPSSRTIQTSATCYHRTSAGRLQSDYRCQWRKALEKLESENIQIALHIMMPKMDGFGHQRIRSNPALKVSTSY